MLATAKAQTTPDNPALGALEGFHLVPDAAFAVPAGISGFIHGTTLASNALIAPRRAGRHDHQRRLSRHPRDRP